MADDPKFVQSPQPLADNYWYSDTERDNMAVPQGESMVHTGAMMNSRRMTNCGTSRDCLCLAYRPSFLDPWLHAEGGLICQTCRSNRLTFGLPLEASPLNGRLVRTA
ncbi:hypothetical protein TEQG_06705 [Trichophyton equinum CBS 127.97]|uniref:Uncharacterized protein n=1 Tax=Trichophyton equinum (strain ATCC MYA-4606 / CBS 127.97) TaxID=559882 RepID=F2Q0Q4_TRIEC|nr:hypothetical protein TEQG_06705 [Trichophyton equinum CBS 127.97]